MMTKTEIFGKKTSTVSVNSKDNTVQKNLGCRAPPFSNKLVDESNFELKLALLVVP